MASRYLPRGGKIKEGVTMKKLNSSYFWSPVEKTEFSVGVVIPVSFQNEVLSKLQIPEGKTKQKTLFIKMSIIGGSHRIRSNLNTASSVVMTAECRMEDRGFESQ